MQYRALQGLLIGLYDYPVILCLSSSCLPTVLFLLPSKLDALSDHVIYPFIAQQSKGLCHMQSRVDALLELCFPFLKGDNSAFIAGIASGLFPQNEYRSLEKLRPEWPK